MNHAGPRIVAVAIADQQITPRALLQHEGKVFAAGERRALHHHAFRPDQCHGHVAGQLRLGQRVDECGIAALIIDVRGAAQTLRLCVHQVLNAALQQGPHLGLQGTHRQLKIRGVGNHVVGGAGRQHAHRHHRRLPRVHVARHHGLQGHDHTRSRHHRIGRPVRHGAMSADAAQCDQHLVARRHHRPLAKHQVALRHARHVVHRKDRVARKALQQAIVQHARRTAVRRSIFFGGLKNQVQRAIELTPLRQHARRAQQHGGMAVMPAGMHGSGVYAGVREAGRLVDRQGVHVGAKADGLGSVADPQLRHHAGAAQAALDAVTPGREALGHQIGGAVFLERQFWMLMNVMPHGDEFVAPLAAQMKDVLWHDCLPFIGVVGHPRKSTIPLSNLFFVEFP